LGSEVKQLRITAHNFRTADNTELVSFLLKRGVDVNIKGKNGSALDIVQEIGNIPELYTLIKGTVSHKNGSNITAEAVDRSNKKGGGGNTNGNGDPYSLLPSSVFSKRFGASWCV
jgi:hypothetical protein